MREIFKDVVLGTLKATAYATLYTLAVWGLFALVGPPHYARVHSTELLSWTFIVTLFAYSNGRSDEAKA